MIFCTYRLVCWRILGEVASCHVVCCGYTDWWLFFVDIRRSLRSMWGCLGFVVFSSSFGIFLVLGTNLVRGNACILAELSVLNTVV